MPYDLEALQIVLFALAYAALLAGYADLVFDRVHSVEIRKKQAAFKAVADDDAVLFDIQLGRRLYGFRLFEDIDAYFQGA